MQGVDTKQIAGIAVAASGAAAVGAWLRLRKPPVHPLLTEYPSLLASHPHVASSFIPFLRLERDEDARRVLSYLSSIAEEDAKALPSSQWKIARLSSAAVKEASSLLSKVETWRSDALYTAKLVAEQDGLPGLRSSLEDALHNHVLRTSSF